MICRICGAKLGRIMTNFPFKINKGRIVIFKNLPVLQCQNCTEYVIEDAVVEKVDDILNKIDKTAELEVLTYVV